MREHLTQRLVDLRRLGLAPQAFAELRLNHREDRLDVAALVVVLQKLFTLELVEVINARPQRTVAVRLAIHLEGYVRDSPVSQSRLEIRVAEISLIAAYLFHLKAAQRGLINERLEVRVIVRVRLADFNARHDVGLDAAYEMHLNPLMLFHLLAILGVKPAQEVSGGEAR